MMDDKQFSSRRKACEACVRSKRRCDMKHPCNRCTRRRVDCQYPKTTADLDSPDSTVGSHSQDSDESNHELTYINGMERDSFMDWNCAIMPLYDTLATIVTFQLSRQSLNFCVRQLQKCTETMMQTASTPWMKPVTAFALVPSPAHDAFSAAASYIARNADTEGFVNELILAKTRDLLSRPCWEFDEHLANAQALLLLHVIQLFDGDIQMRAEAENSWLLVQSRIMSLLDRQDHEIPASVTTSAWLKWTFLESVRRTYLMYVFVEAMYQNLKQGYCELVPLLGTLPIALDGALWNAQSEAEWIEVNKHRSPAIITYGEAVPIWHEMKTEQNRDLETMHEMLWVACKGELPYARRTLTQHLPGPALPATIEVA